MAYVEAVFLRFERFGRAQQSFLHFLVDLFQRVENLRTTGVEIVAFLLDRLVVLELMRGFGHFLPSSIDEQQLALQDARVLVVAHGYQTVNGRVQLVMRLRPVVNIGEVILPGGKERSFRSVGDFFSFVLI